MSREVTQRRPTSSVWSQLFCPQGRCWQSRMEASYPRQRRSSSQTAPMPGPKVLFLYTCEAPDHPIMRHNTCQSFPYGVTSKLNLSSSYPTVPSIPTKLQYFNYWHPEEAGNYWSLWQKIIFLTNGNLFIKGYYTQYQNKWLTVQCYIVQYFVYTRKFWLLNLI